MPYTNIEARRKNQREWIAKKRAAARAKKQQKCGTGAQVKSICKLCVESECKEKEGEQK